MNRSAFLFSVVSLSVGSLFTGHAQAVPIGLYPFTGGSAASTDADPNSTAGAATIGAVPSTNWGFSSSTNTAFAQSNVTPSSQALAISGNSFFSFTLAPNAGFKLDMTSLTFDTAYNQFSGTVAGASTASYFVRSSVDGFASNIGPTLTDTYNDVVHASDILQPQNVSLSAALFQNLMAPVTFRIYIHHDSTLNTRVVRIDNVSFNGTVSIIPEPASATLGLLAMAGLMLRRRRLA